jgi:hypothetical protein
MMSSTQPERERERECVCVCVCVYYMIRLTSTVCVRFDSIELVRFEYTHIVHSNQ